MNKKLLLLVLVFVGLTGYAQKSKTTTTTTTTTTAAPVETKPVVAPAPKVASTSSSLGKPSNPLEIGISGGLHQVWGDVNSRVGFNLDNSTIGIHVRKALSHSFSWRWQYNYGTATMQHFMPHYTAVANGISSNPNNNTWFVASQMYSHAFAWDNILTVGNTSMYKNNTKWILDFFAGPAAFFYRTKINATDANGTSYMNNGVWSTAESIYTSNIMNYTNNNSTQDVVGDNRAKRMVAEYLDSKLDNTYETLADNNRVKNQIGGYAIVPAATFGAGFTYAINDKFNLGLEERFYYVFDDYLDGERWANFTSTAQYSQMNDMVMNTTLKLNYNLGKKGAKPLYWRNANEEIQKKLASMNPNKAINEALADEDGDGVPNILDQESGSREGCPVDTKGIMLDSDKDGLLDCDDKEPFSPAGYPIDNNGVAKVPPPACCDQIKKAAEVVPTPPVNTPSAACAETTLPSVKFDNDRYGMNSAMVPSLQTIGEKMQKCPDMKLVVNGINDRNNKNGKYNEQLSYNRASEVTNYLVEKFGISRDRFIVRYNLEGTGDQDADRAVMFRNAQEGETGSSNPPSPHPGLKAGKK